jgi:hypothetical protein
MASSTHELRSSHIDLPNARGAFGGDRDYLSLQNGSHGKELQGSFGVGY